MREKKFTAGPWEVGHKGQSLNIHPKNMFSRLIGMAFLRFSPSTEEAKANANLIAAAPELLEALEGSCRICASDNGIVIEDCRADLCNVKRAINKAYGE